MLIDEKDLINAGFYDCPDCRCEMVDRVSKNGGDEERICHDCGFNFDNCGFNFDKAKAKKKVVDAKPSSCEECKFYKEKGKSGAGKCRVPSRSPEDVDCDTSACVMAEFSDNVKVTRIEKGKVKMEYRGHTAIMNKREDGLWWVLKTIDGVDHPKHDNMAGGNLEIAANHLKEIISRGL